MRNIRLTIAYVGTNYNGFQTQPHGNTVQDKLETFLSRLCNGPVHIIGSGRTDAGVHALGQVVSFTTDSSIPCRNIRQAARTLLPPDIYILSAEDVNPDFHARYSAKRKTYLYRVHPGEYSPFLAGRAWQIPQKPDLGLMQQAAQQLLGTHDFSSFRSTGSAATNPLRTIYAAQWRLRGGELFFTVTGDGFLYRMVRNMVGIMLDIGLGKKNLSELYTADKTPAPPDGLYLASVEY